MKAVSLLCGLASLVAARKAINWEYVTEVRTIAPGIEVAGWRSILDSTLWWMGADRENLQGPQAVFGRTRLGRCLPRVTATQNKISGQQV
jgi:hypothetical protein